MLGGDALDLGLLRHEQRLVAVEGAAHALDHGEQARVRAGRQHHGVPLVVLGDDELVLDELIDEGVGHLLEPSADGLQLLERAELEREALQGRHDGGQVAELGGAERHEAEALAVLALDLSLGLEGDEGLAQRRAADAELGGELHLVDPLAGLHESGPHPGEELLAHLRAQVLAFDGHRPSPFCVAPPLAQPMG